MFGLALAFFRHCDNVDSAVTLRNDHVTWPGHDCCISQQGTFTLRHLESTSRSICLEFGLIHFLHLQLFIFTFTCLVSLWLVLSTIWRVRMGFSFSYMVFRPCGIDNFYLVLCMKKIILIYQFHSTIYTYF